MPAGKVKWFNNAKGYGFVLAEGSDEDLFVHYSSIMMDGYKTLKAGQPVAFRTTKANRGTHAIDVHVAKDETHARELAVELDQTSTEIEKRA
ncbi:cold shock domain-containing protein [Gynuella sp.]|uniref:cold shock domain-containing protein n=1 Tax=Gynuella sp. TaxID=2969146 RepID=UPI003D0EDC77